MVRIDTLETVEASRRSVPIDNLLPLEDIEGVGRTRKLAEGDQVALHAVAQWIRTFVARPHKALGRPGPVCPFVPEVSERKTLWLAAEQIATRSIPDVVQLIDGYRKLFADTQPVSGDDAIYKSILVVFTDLPADRAKPLFDDVLQHLGAASYVEDGLVLGGFYERIAPPAVARMIRSLRNSIRESNPALSKKGNAMTLIKTLAATAITAGALFAAGAFAQTAKEIRGASPYVAVENEPAPRLIVDPPLPEGLAQGVFWAQYRVENLRIVQVFGAGARQVSPRVGHLHITVDDLPWWWADASDNNTIDIAGLPPGQHKVKISLVDADHNVFPGQVTTLTFIVPDHAKMSHGGHNK